MKSKKIITSLFNKKEGSFFVCKPIIVAYKTLEATHFKAPQVAFTVSKSKFKRAVDRNRIKRLLREAYRTQNQNFIEDLKAQNKSMALMFIYNKNRIETQEIISNSVQKALNAISN